MIVAPGPTVVWWKVGETPGPGLSWLPCPWHGRPRWKGRDRVNPVSPPWKSQNSAVENHDVWSESHVSIWENFLVWALVESASFYKHASRAAFPDQPLYVYLVNIHPWDTWKYCLINFWVVTSAVPNVSSWTSQGLSGKEFTCYAEEVGLIPGSGRSPGGGNGNPPQYSCLGNLMDKRSLVGYSSWGCKRVGHNLATTNTVPKIISRKGLSPQKGNVLVHLDYCSEILCDLWKIVYFSQFWIWKSKIRVPVWLGRLSLCPHLVEWLRELCGVSHMGTNPILEDSTLMS